MPHNAPETPISIECCLKTINGDVRKFAKALERAKAAKTAGDIEAHLRELSCAKKTLQQHRAQVRQCIAHLGAKGAGKDKLGAARTCIEQELRKFSEFEKKVESTVSRPTLSCHIEGSDCRAPDTVVRGPGPAPCEAAVAAVAAKRGDSRAAAGGGDVRAPRSQLLRAQAEATADQGDAGAAEGGEVKVLKSQLLNSQVDDEDITKEFVCKICLDIVGASPQLTRCAHLFCGDCLKRWFDAQPKNQTWAGRAQFAGLVPCPVCKEPLCSTRDLHKVCAGQKGSSAFLWKMLSSLEVLCSNNSKCNPDGKCDWTGTYASFQTHIRTCANVPLCSAAALAHATPIGGSAGALDGAAHVAKAELRDDDDEDGGAERTVSPPTSEEGDAAACCLEHEDEQVVQHIFEEDEPDSLDDLDFNVLVDNLLDINRAPAAPPVVQPVWARQESPALPVSQAAYDIDELEFLRAEREFDELELVQPPQVGATITKQQSKQALANETTFSAQFAAEAQRQAYAQQLAQWQAAQAAHQMAYNARLQAAAQWQAAYAAQWQAAYAAQARASLGGR